MRNRFIIMAAIILSIALALGLAGCAGRRAPNPAPAAPPAGSGAADPATAPPATGADAPAQPPPATDPAPPADPAPAGDAEPRGDAVRVTVPDPDSEVSGDTIHVEGKARTFEATVLVEVEDGHNILGRAIITATEAAPAWGDFAADIKLEQLPTNRTLTVIFYTESAADGSRQELALIPLRYTGPCADNRC